MARDVIQSRRDLERYRRRSDRRGRLMLGVMLITALCSTVVFALPVIGEFQRLGFERGMDEVIPALVGGCMAGGVCMGPLVTAIYWYVTAAGVREYRRVYQQLVEQQRVCYRCSAIALFEDAYLQAVQSRRHTRADLIPRMPAVEGRNGEIVVLCPRCLAERDPRVSTNADLLDL